jgi:Flp pilus assembly pilin Flp
MADVGLRVWVAAQQWLKDQLHRAQTGQTMVEYAFLLVLIAIVVILMVTLVGDRANIIFNRMAANLDRP